MAWDPDPSWGTLEILSCVEHRFLDTAPPGTDPISLTTESWGSGSSWEPLELKRRNFPSRIQAVLPHLASLLSPNSGAKPLPRPGGLRLRLWDC